MQKITDDQYQAFLKYYMWNLLQHPDYRLGEAFINYFTDISDELIYNLRNENDFTWELYGEGNSAKAQKMINLFREKK